MLPNYYHHVGEHENTLITKFFGLHRIKLRGGRKVSICFFCVTFYVLPNILFVNLLFPEKNLKLLILTMKKKIMSLLYVTYRCRRMALYISLAIGSTNYYSCLTMCVFSQVRFVVMGNMFYTELRIHRRYDLKGSSHGRFTDKDKVDQNTTLKDCDLAYEFHMDKLLRQSLFK